jgi:hypothetical protein
MAPTDIYHFNLHFDQSWSLNVTKLINEFSVRWWLTSLNVGWVIIQLRVLATSKRLLATGATFRIGLTSENLIATSVGTHRSLVTHTNKYGWALS